MLNRTRMTRIKRINADLKTQTNRVLSFPRAALVVIHKSVQDRYFSIDAGMTASDVGRNKSARRQQGRMFPAIGAPETPVLRLTRGQAYSGLRRDVYNDERAAWECSAGRAASPIRQTLAVIRGAARLDCIPTRRVGTSVSCAGSRAGAWEPAQHNIALVSWRAGYQPVNAHEVRF